MESRKDSCYIKLKLLIQFKAIQQITLVSDPI